MIRKQMQMWLALYAETPRDDAFLRACIRVLRENQNGICFTPIPNTGVASLRCFINAGGVKRRLILADRQEVILYQRFFSEALAAKICDPPPEYRSKIVLYPVRENSL